MAIVTAGDKGRNAFVGNRGIHYLCETVIRQTFRCEDALKVSNIYEIYPEVLVATTW